MFRNNSGYDPRNHVGRTVQAQIEENRVRSEAFIEALNRAEVQQLLAEIVCIETLALLRRQAS